MTTTPNRHGSLSALSRYGNLQPPEERRVPDVKESSAATLSFAFLVWLQSASPTINLEQIYASSIDFLQPYKGMLKSLHDQAPLGQFRHSIPNSELAQYFFSAALNMSGVPVFADVFTGWRDVGYMLPKGKTLIALPGSDVIFLGTRAMGNVYNFGFAQSIGSYAEGAVLVNKKEARSMGNNSICCTCINDGAVEVVSSDAAESILVNAAIAELRSVPGRSILRGLYGSLGQNSEHSVSINLGRVESYIASHSSGNLIYSGNTKFIDFEELVKNLSYRIYDSCGFFTAAGKGVLEHRYYPQIIKMQVSPEAARLFKSLEAKASEAVSACRAGSTIDETVASMASYDWAGFRNEIKLLRGRIEQVVKS